MSDDPSRVTPVAPDAQALERGAVERVLARAAELQGKVAEPGEPMVTEGQLLDIGREVGLAPEFLRQALAEERTRIVLPDEGGVLAQTIGPARVQASRVMPGDPAQLLAALDLMMQTEELLRVKRRFPDRVLWEPRSGFAAEFRRALNVGGHGYHLSRAGEVAATVVAVDETRSLVHLAADIGNLRSHRLAGGGAFAATGAAVTGSLLVLGFANVVAFVPAAGLAAAGWLTARGHRATAVRAQLSLEQALDRLERGELPRGSLLAALSATARDIALPPGRRSNPSASR